MCTAAPRLLIHTDMTFSGGHLNHSWRQRRSKGRCSGLDRYSRSSRFNAAIFALIGSYLVLKHRVTVNGAKTPTCIRVSHYLRMVSILGYMYQSRFYNSPHHRRLISATIWHYMQIYEYNTKKTFSHMLHIILNLHSYLTTCLVSHLAALQICFSLYNTPHSDKACH